MSERDDDDPKPRRRRAPLPPAAAPAAAEPVVLSLRDVTMPPPPDARVEQTDSEFVLSDDEVQPEPWLGDPDAERAAQRAARRAQVRRDRFRGAPGADADDVPQVLVLDADAASRQPLCELLESFGFQVTSSAALPAAEPPWPYVAVFVDFATRTDDDGDGIELAKQVRELARELGDARSVMVLVAQQLSSIDRVRAGLAGCDETVLKPLTRGNVARALDTRGVALPSDSRRV